MLKFVLEKLDDEYEMFFLNLMRTTKENIYSKSYEIEQKKRINVHLQEVIGSYEKEEAKLERLRTMNHILDECYRYVVDHPNKKIESACDDFLEAI